MKSREMSIGEVSHRSGVPISTLHFYEQKGLIASQRNLANHRVFSRDILRRISIIKVAQASGVSLAEIASSLAALPNERTPTLSDWTKLSEEWHGDLTQRIETLTALRDKMAGCIGCGCLSLKKCHLFNENDHLSQRGAGAHLLP